MGTFSSPPKIPLEWVGFFNQTGYGQSAVSSVLALHRSGRYDIRIRSLSGAPPEIAFSTEDLVLLRAMSLKPENDRSVQVLHSIPEMHRRVRRHARTIGLATFETFQPPDEWGGLLNRCDAVVCPSIFNREQFERTSLRKPIFVIPHVLDFGIWNPQVRPMPKDERFTFLFVGTWRRRKGWEALAEAWMREFAPNEPVRLLVKTDKVERAKEDILSMKKSLGRKDIAPIVFEKEVFTDRQMASFVKSADCYVSPTMGEGFGLPALQSMALKVPVIITNFSGCQEYAKNNNCTLLEPSGFMVHKCIDPIPQFANRKWPRIKVSTVQEAMRSVFQNYEVALQKADIAYEFVRQNFNYEVFVSKFDEMMEAVYGAGKSQAQAIQRNPVRS